MKKYILILFFLVLNLPCFAVPTIYGPTGLIEMPTAESLRYKEINIAYDYLIISSSNASAPAKESYYYKINIGTFRGWELGFRGGTNPSDGVYINAKYYLMSDSSRYPLSIALGVENLTSSSSTDVYLVATKKFEGGFTGNFGFKADFAQEDSYIMAGVEYFLTDDFSIVCDLTGEQKIYYFNIGARYSLLSDLQIRASMVNVGNILPKESYISLGISYAKFF